MACTEPCPTCPRKYAAVGGDGPQPARILAIGERPGENENKNKLVFCGKTGQEWNELYLPLAGLRRSGVRVVNTVMCWADNNRKPTPKEISDCAGFHLPGEIARTNPEVIILMGATPCSLCPGIRLDMHHGIPQHTRKVGSLFGWEGWIWPQFHPALGLHESRFMTMMLEDWERMGRELWNPTDDCPAPPHTYHLAADHHALDELVDFDRVAIDTESHGGEPWSVQLSWRPHHGVLIPAKDKRTLRHLNALLQNDYEVTFHHAAHDLDELEKMGITLPQYARMGDDTMQRAFQMGNLPQGLKALAYRLFRVTMTSWEDVVRPASIEVLLEWMVEALRVAQLDLPFKEAKLYKTCRCGHGQARHQPSCASKGCSCAGFVAKQEWVDKPSTVESLLTRLIRLTDVRSEYDPWERLDEFWAEGAHEFMTGHLEARVGKYPILGIGNCKLDRAIEYAVGDADFTGQAAAKLADLRQDAFKIYAGDVDV